MLKQQEVARKRVLNRLETEELGRMRVEEQQRQALEEAAQVESQRQFQNVRQAAIAALRELVPVYEAQRELGNRVIAAIVDWLAAEAAIRERLGQIPVPRTGIPYDDARPAEVMAEVRSAAGLPAMHESLEGLAFPPGRAGDIAVVIMALLRSDSIHGLDLVVGDREFTFFRPGRNGG